MYKAHQVDTVIHLAGYSRHDVLFHYFQQRNGLNAYLFRLQTHGQARALVADEFLDIVPGDLLLYHPGDPYELIIQSEDDMHQGRPMSCDYFVFCSGSWIDDWWNRCHKPTFNHIPLEDGLLAIWRQLAMEQLKVEGTSADISDYLLKTLCLMIERAVTGAGLHRNQSGAFVSYRMKNYIEENASSQITVEDVASFVGLSLSRAVRLFKESFGTSIIQYVLQVRLKMAAERISFDNMTLEQVAESCGFNSYSYFHRVFRSRFGVSPRQYRLDGR